MINNKLVALFGVLASGAALSHQKVPWVPKAVVKGFGAGVLAFDLWNVQPSNGVTLKDAMILNKAADQLIKNDNPTKVESPYPPLNQQDKERLKEINAAEDKKNADYENMLKDPARSKDLLDAKTELIAKIDDLKSTIDFNFFALEVLTLINSIVLIRLTIMAYLKMEDIEIKRLELKVKEYELELKKKAAESWWPRK